MRDGGADRQPAAVGELAELADALDVDEMRRAEQPELHEQEQLGAAGVRHGVLAEPGQERAGLLGRLGPVQRERPEHRQRPSAAAGRTSSSAIICKYSMRALGPRGRL